MATTFFSDLFDSIRTAGEGLGDGMSNILDITMPVFGSVFVVYMIFIVWGYWQNGASIEGMAIDSLKRIVGLGLLIGLGMNYGTYSSTVFPTVSSFGNELAQAWGGAENQGAQLDNIVEKILQITDTNQMDAETALDETVPEVDPNAPTPSPKPSPSPADDPLDTSINNDEGIISGVIDSVTGMGEAVFANTIGKLSNTLTATVQNTLIYIATAIFLVVAAAYMLVAQIILILLAAIGPIFFGFGIFPATRQFFTNWIGSVLNYAFLFLFMTVSAELFILFIDSQLDIWRSEFMAGAVLQPSLVLTILAMFAVFAVMLLQVPSVTSNLFGGLASGGFANAYSAARNFKTMLPKVGGKSTNTGAKQAKSGGTVKAESAGR